jgi:hypothetical protein
MCAPSLKKIYCIESMLLSKWTSVLWWMKRFPITKIVRNCDRVIWDSPMYTLPPQ